MNKPTRKYKVLHLLEWFELGGGLEMIAGEIATGLNKDVFDAQIWCLCRGGKLVEEFRQKGIKVRILNITSYHNPLNIIKLVQLFKEAKPDIVHTHVYFASTIGRIAAKLAGVKVCINHVHSSYWHYTKLNILMERLLSLWTSKIICVSEHVRTFVVEYEKINADRVVIIRNGISRKDVCKPPDHSDHFVITIVASLFANKGHMILLDAIALLRGRYPQIKCWIVGEGEMGTELKQYAKDLGIDQDVVFWGVRWDVPQLLLASQLFVLTSIFREGLPISILEAMAYGVPVVASSVGGIPEIIKDGINGCLVLPQDAQQLADCIEELIKDPDKCMRLALAGKKTFEEDFEAKKMVAQIEDVYRKALS